MAQERPSRVHDWVHAVRTQTPVVRAQFREWTAEVKEDPGLIWQTAVVRYLTYGVMALLAAWLVRGGITLIAPPPPPNSRPTATSADFFCRCAASGCGRRFVIHRPFGFDDFPVECPRCSQPSGLPARPCHSAACRGDWVVPTVRDDGKYCSICGTRFD